MSGILGRFKTIMEANVNALLDKAENPVKMAEQLARDLEDDLGRVKAETASVMAEVKRAQRAYDECAETVEKLQKYAEAAVLKGNDVDAKAFLMEKAEKSKTLEGLAGALDVAKANADKMRQLHDQLESQLRQINERKAAIRAKAAMADAKERTAELGRSIGGAAENLSAFDRLEEKIETMFLKIFFFKTGFLCVALAVLELRNPPASASPVLGLKVCATTPGQISLLPNFWLKKNLS